MKLLAVGRPREGADVRGAISRQAPAEMRALWALYRDGIVREMYSPGGPGAVLVLEAATKGDAIVALAGLPLVASGVISFEFIELHPFAALGVLFAADVRILGANHSPSTGGRLCRPAGAGLGRKPGAGRAEARRRARTRRTSW